MGHLTRRATLGGMLGLVFASEALGAAPWSLPEPSGPVILTVSGEIKHRNSGNDAIFDMPMIEALGHDAFTTKTPWSGRARFSGVRLSTLLATVGAYGRMVIAECLNDYSAKIPMSYIASHDPLLATRMNGAFMPVSKFGPLFIVADFDAHPDWMPDFVGPRCPWELSGLRIGA